MGAQEEEEEGDGMRVRKDCGCEGETMVVDGEPMTCVDYCPFHESLLVVERGIKDLEREVGFLMDAWREAWRDGDLCRLREELEEVSESAQALLVFLDSC